MDKKEYEETKELVIDFKKRGGLVPVVAQDSKSGRILMLAYANKEALDKTMKLGLATFWSTSRNELWTKGETSGDYLEIVNILTDCDQDTLICVVEPKGAGACHTHAPGSRVARESCFYRKLDLETGKLEFL